MHNHQKKIAVINDLSGFGRCSLAVELPIISMMKVQCCPLPTSMFSSHTGFPGFYMKDCTNDMLPYMEQWHDLGLKFNGICTGFLGSVEQIALVEHFFKLFDSTQTTVIMDPVIGDYGKPYPTYTDEMCQKLKSLVHYADILTPNLTEACILTDTPYKDNWEIAEVSDLARLLSAQGPEKVVITGFAQGDMLCNLCYERNEEPTVIREKKIGSVRSGTGDIFTAILAADAINGISLTDSVQKAASFIRRCIEASIRLDIPLTDGVCFEEVLDTLQ